jgi:hypothetical protein
MDESEAKSLCKDLLVMSEDIEFVAVSKYPGGDVRAIETRIPVGSNTPQKHFNIFANMMTDVNAKLEGRFGSAKYFLLNFSLGQIILFPTKDNVVALGTKPLASPALITLVADRLRLYIPS